MENLTVSVEQASKMTSLAPRTLHRLMAEGELASIKLGKRRLVVMESLRKLLTPETPTGSE